MKNLQKVKVVVSVSGSYCAFHEISFDICYDITNDIQLDDYSLEELQEKVNSDWDCEYSDYEIRNAIYDSLNKKYYVEWR